MDAGIAGLIGALGGGIIGATGAWVAALIAFRGARYQADQQRLSSHQQWLRQIRREAYTSYLSAAEEVFQRAASVASEQLSAAERQAAFDAAKATRLFDLELVLQLEAPLGVRDAARQVGVAATESMTAVAQHAPGPTEAMLEAFYERIQALRQECRRSLQASS